MLPTVLTCRQGSESTGLGLARCLGISEGQAEQGEGCWSSYDRHTGARGTQNQPHAASTSPEVGWSWSGFE